MEEAAAAEAEGGGVDHPTRLGTSWGGPKMTYDNIAFDSDPLTAPPTGHQIRNVALAAATARFSRTIIFHGFLDFQSEGKLLTIFNDFVFVRPSTCQKSS